MALANVVSLEEFRKERVARDRRQALHEFFDRWLDEVEEAMKEKPSTLEAMTQAVWEKRQELTGKLVEGMVEQAHPEALSQEEILCSGCGRVLKARGTEKRTVETKVGKVELLRPYFYCVRCRQGYYPLDEALELSARCKQWGLQQGAVELAAEVAYKRASFLFEKLTGLPFSDHMIHQVVGEVTEGLTVLSASPTASEIEQKITQAAAGKKWRPVVVLSIDGACVPTRPEEAKGRRPGRKQKRAKRARWQGQWREAKGFRFYLVDGERIVHLLSWHQVQSEGELGEALRQVKEAGLIPEDKIRLCVIADGAHWVWKQVQAMFPSAVQILDYYHCSEHLHRVAALQFAHHPEHQTEWVEATLARLFAGEVEQVLVDLHSMKARHSQAAEVIRQLIGYLANHQDRVSYGFFRKGGYPIGSGGIESAHKTIGHVRLKRSGAWWYVENANHMLALRCAIYNDTFERIFELYKQKARECHQEAASVRNT